MRSHLTGTLLVAVLLCAAGLFGQGTTSRVTGVVTDPTGAVVPGASVTMTNEGTGVSLTTRTTSAGVYVFDSVRVGVYTVSVKHGGFKTFVSAGNVLTIGQPMTVNAQLEVGQPVQSVEVRGAAELVQTSSSGNFGNQVNQQTIEQLPIVDTRGRNPLDLVLFQPGVVEGGNTGGGVNVNGSRDRAWNFTLDGLDINEVTAGGSNYSPVNTNPDSLAEFRVITSNLTPEYGRVSGGQVAMVTRQGTNQFHGEGFWFYQTPRLQANAYDNNLNGLPKGQFVQQIYGGSIGGPVRKDKTFFFANLQFLHALQTLAVTNNVFTSLARQGVFRYVKGGRNLPAGVPGASVDSSGNPLAGVNLGSYAVATSNPEGLTLDPAIQAVIAKTPLPNNFTSGDGLNIAGFSWSAPDTQKNVDLTLRIDQVINQRNTIFGRWYQGHENTIGDIVNDGLAPFPGLPNVVDTYRVPRNLAVGWTSSLASTVTNELVAGFNRYTFNFANPDPNFKSNPPFDLVIVTNPLQNYVGNLRAITTLQLVDNLTMVRGAHTFKTGINFHYITHIDKRGSVGGWDVEPSVDFDPSVNTIDPTTFKLPKDINTAHDLPNLETTINDLLGRVGTIGQGFVSNGNTWAPGGSVFNFNQQYPEYDFYGQDSWRVRPHLVVDYGVRWEMLLSPRNPRNEITHPNQPFVVGSAPSNTLTWVKGPLYNNAYGNIGPSVGLAWDPFGTGKTSIRANYSLLYDPINTFSISSGIFELLPGLTYGVTDIDFGEGGGLLRKGLPVLAPPTGLTPSQLTQPPPFSAGSVTVMDPNWRPPKVNEWALSVQREVASNMVLEVNYIGNHGVGLYGGYDANQVDISNNGFLGAFNAVRAGGDSPLIDELLSHDSRLKPGETGSQEVRRLFPTTLALGSVASLAAAIGTRTQGGVPIIQLAGFSPYLFFHYPQFAGGFNVLDSNDVSTYNALQIQLQRRFSPGLTFQVSYAFSKSLDTRSFDPTFSRVRRGNSQSASSTPYNIYDRRLNYAPSDFDRRHALQGAWMWNLPFGQAQRWGNHWNPVLDRVLGGWTTAGILRWTSGRPFTVYSGAFTLGNVVSSPASCSGCSGGETRLQFNPTAGTQYLFTPQQISQFSAPSPGSLGNTSRNFFRLPPWFNLDLDIAKKIRTTEHQYLEIRADMINATNTPAFDTADSSTITSSVFGRMRDAVFNDARTIQLGMKYYF